jgi:glycosyltransferase involved in cell wall biosynthesis
VRIAVDLVYFTGKKGGTETYARSLYTAIGRNHPDVELVGLLNTELRNAPPSWFPGETVNLPVSGENRVAWALAENTLVPAAARHVRADVLHCPANFGPLLSRVPVVLTVHDLLGFRFPELIPGSARGVQLLARTSVRGARALITDSAASAADLREFLSVPSDCIEVVPLAAGDAPRASSETPKTSGRPFLLSTGNRLPHKNFAALLRALATIPRPQRPLLVLPGSHGDDPLRPLVAELGLDEDVELRGWVAADELDALYRGAMAYVLPSRFEGFGLPVLEAMSRGCPVVCSDLPVLREVGGDAALYTDTRDVRAFASTITRVLIDDGLQMRLVSAGLKQAMRFSWEQTARATYEVLRYAAGR